MDFEDSLLGYGPETAHSRRPRSNSRSKKSRAYEDWQGRLTASERAAVEYDDLINPVEMLDLTEGDDDYKPSYVMPLADRMASHRAMQGYWKGPTYSGRDHSATHKVMKELKVYETQDASATGTAGGNVTPYEINTTGKVVLIFCPDVYSDGTTTDAFDFTNRVGRKCVVRSLNIRGLILGGLYQAPFAATGFIEPQFARIMIIYDLEPPTKSGTSVLIDEILQAASSFQPLNSDNTIRFRIVMDKHYAIGAAYTDTSTKKLVESEGRHCFLLEKYKKCKLPVRFGPSTSGNRRLADIVKGAIYLVTVGSQADSASESPVLQCEIRARFSDS